MIPRIQHLFHLCLNRGISMWMYSFLVLIFVVVVGVLSEDKSVTVGNITTKVKGQSGKIAVYRGMIESDGITITFDAIEEIDTDGNKIQSHSYNNFAQLTFTFSNLENTTYIDSNVTVTQFSFKSSINIEGGYAMLTSNVYIFTADGIITVDGKSEEVMAGDMKFNVKIENWPFCYPCSKGNQEYNGTHPDFSVEIKGKKSPNATSGGKYDLGDGFSVLTPKQVIFDNTTTEDMPSGYPKLEMKGSKQTFIFRFRKFDESALYDPIVSVGNDDGGDNAGDDSGTETADVTTSGISAKVLGKSGKITLAQTTGEDKKSVTIVFDNLKEKKDNGDAVKDSGHLLNTFANQDFTFETPADDTYPGTSIMVRRLTFQSTLNNGASLKIHIYIFKQAGNITQENETVAVTEGNVKFNIEIMDWSFCKGTSCQQSEVGKYLDIDILMKAKSGSTKKDDTDAKYTLGDSGSVMLSRKIKVDGASDLVDMEPSYPMFTKQGSKDIFRFRFPKFTTSVLYDPTIYLGGSDGTNSAVQQTVSVFMFATMAFLYFLL